MVVHHPHKVSVAGSSPAITTKFALVFQRLEFRFCSPAMEVRVLPGAPSFVRVSASEITLVRFLRRTELVEGEGSIP
jgi:hypothetical protein